MANPGKMTNAESDSEISEDESEDLGTVDLSALEESLNDPENREVQIRKKVLETDPGRIRDEEIKQISSLMLWLPPDCLRDIVTEYLQSQRPSRARELLGSWGKHWSNLLISRPARLARRAQPRYSKLREVFISSSEFSPEDRDSMLSCFYRSAA